MLCTTATLFTIGFIWENYKLYAPDKDYRKNLYYNWPQVTLDADADFPNSPSKVEQRKAMGSHHD